MLGLTGALLERLEALQIPVWTPRDPARHAANVCLPSERAGEVAKALGERGVWVWNGQGRVRVSFHGYNGLADVDRVAEAVREVWRG
jgi:cysteine desulfurase / selenocysteine lyase